MEFSELTKDAILLIAAKLDDNSLFNLSQTNKKIAQICKNQDFWRNRFTSKFVSRFNMNINMHKIKCWKALYIRNSYYFFNYKKKDLLEDVFLNFMDKVTIYAHSQVPLYLAAKNNDLESINLIINERSNLDYGMQGAALGGHMELIEFFIEKGCKNWNAGLMGAATGGNLNIVKFFHKKGADNLNGAYLYALENRHNDIAEYLEDSFKNNY